MMWQQNEAEKKYCADRENRMYEVHRKEYSPCMRQIYQWRATHKDQAAMKLKQESMC
jgi:hypothetical protein